MGESARACGYRVPGGLYVVSEPLLGASCAKLPLNLDVCPTCHGGIKFSRGFTVVDGDALAQTTQPCEPGCPMGTPGMGKAGLLWLGTNLYTPESWLVEAMRMGVSRRIPFVPNDFKPGMWILMARQRNLSKTEKVGEVFHVFRAKAIEYILKGDESPDQLDRLTKKGVRLVKLERAGEETLCQHRFEADGAYCAKDRQHEGAHLRHAPKAKPERKERPIETVEYEAA